MHDPDDSVHEVVGRPEIMKLPPLPPSLNVTMRVGVDASPMEVSDTVTVYVIVFPIITDDGLGSMIVSEVRTTVTA